MNKRTFLAVLAGSATVALVLFGKIFVYATPPKTVIFSGINGQTISVYTDHVFSEQKNSPAGDSTVKAGDIIEIDNSQEIVIGVSDDGRYITMPLEDYRLDHQNN